MIKTNTYNPSIAIHPGKTLEETLEASGMAQVDLAQRTGLTPKHINEIIKRKTSITVDTAIKLSNVFGMSATFWNNLQKNYDENAARLKAERSLKDDLVIFRRFTCYNELVKWKYIRKVSSVKEKINNLINFFGVSSLSFVPKAYGVAFRIAERENISKECLAAWLRCGEIDAQKTETKPFSKNKLESSIDALRLLTNENPEVFSGKLRKICADFGVAVVFVSYFSNTYVNGATRWINSDKAMIQLSLRGRSDDIFWFTFFHELAHILVHGKKEQFVEFNNNDQKSVSEKEADEIAGNILIPKNHFRQFMNSGNFSASSIREFAKRIGVSPSIVAGRLAHETGNWRAFARMHIRLKFKDPC